MHHPLTFILINIKFLGLVKQYPIAGLRVPAHRYSKALLYIALIPASLCLRLALNCLSQHEQRALFGKVQRTYSSQGVAAR